MTNLNELRTRISDLSRLALRLHAGSDQELFDNMQAKIGRVMKAFALHEHDIVQQQQHYQSLLSRMEKSESSEKNALQQLAKLEIEYSKLLTQKKSTEQDLGSFSQQNQSLQDSIKWEQTLRRKCETKLNTITQSFESQKAQIKQAQSLTDANLKQLHQWLKDERLKNAALKDMNQELKLSNTNLEQTVQSLTNNIAELEQHTSQFDQLVTECEKLSESNAQLNKEKQLLQNMIDNQNEKISTLTDNLDKTNQQLNELKIQLVDCQQNLQQSETLVTKEKALFEQQQKDNNHMEQELEKKRNLCATLQIKLNSQNSVVATKEEFVEQLKHELSLLQSSCDLELEKQQNKYENKVLQLNSSIKELTQQISTLQSEKRDDKIEFTKIVSQLDNEKETSSKLMESQKFFQNRHDVLKTQLQDTTKTVNQLTSKVAQLEANIVEKDEIIQTKDNILQLRNADVANISEKLKTSVDLLETTENKLEKLQNTTQELSKSKNEVVELKSKNSQLENHVLNLTHQLTTAQEKIESLHEKISKQRSSYKVLLNKDEYELNNLTHRLTDAQKEISDNNQENQHLRHLIQQQKHSWEEERLQLKNMIDKLKQDYDYEVESNNNNKQITSKQLENENCKTQMLKTEIERRDRLLSKTTMEISKLKAELALKSSNVPILRESNQTFHVIDKTNHGSKQSDKTALPFSRRFVVHNDLTADSIATDSFLMQ